MYVFSLSTNHELIFKQDVDLGLGMNASLELLLQKTTKATHCHIGFK